MKDVLFIIMWFAMLYCQSQETTTFIPDMNHASADRRFLDDAKLIVKSADKVPEIVCIVNPTEQNSVECQWSLYLMSWLVHTGQFSTIYFDMDAFIAMLCDRYVRCERQVTSQDVEGYIWEYCKEFNINLTNMMMLLSGIRAYNEHSDNKVGIRGLNYDFNFLPFYDKPCHLIDSLISCAIGESSYKFTRDYLIKNEQKERVALGSSYDVYRRFFDLDRVHINMTKSLDSRMFDEFIYWHKQFDKGAKSILFLSIWSMREVPDIPNFREGMKKNFRDNDYKIINLVDETIKHYPR